MPKVRRVARLKVRRVAQKKVKRATTQKMPDMVLIPRSFLDNLGLEQRIRADRKLMREYKKKGISIGPLG